MNERKPAHNRPAFKEFHSGRRNSETLFFSDSAKVQKFLIILNRDTGQIIPVEATTPIEYVPFGFCALPYHGTRLQIDRLIRKYQRKPSLLDKYTDR